MNRILQPAAPRVKNNGSSVVASHPACAPFSRFHFPFSIFRSLLSKSFPCHTSEISPVTPLVATDPKIPSCKPFACHTSDTPLLPKGALNCRLSAVSSGKTPCANKNAQPPRRRRLRRAQAQPLQNLANSDWEGRRCPRIEERGRGIRWEPASLRNSFAAGALR
jgi:hypothetical protein